MIDPDDESTNAEGTVATQPRRSRRISRPVESNDDGQAHRPQSPFVRLARVHALTSGGDAIVAIALAGSLFFIDPEAARSRVLLYLLLTVAPFVLVGPLIGPALDKARGGRKTMIVLINALRVVTSSLVAFYLTSALALFPIVFLHMVLGKSYAVAKAAVVPSTVQSSSELVDKNSRLAVLTAVASGVAVVPAALAQLIGGPRVATVLAALAYLLAAVAATRLPQSEPAPSNSAGALATTGNVFLASSAMAVMRGIVGFMTFLAAFKFGGRADELDLSGTGRAVGASVRASVLGIEGEGRPVWKLGLLLACVAGGSFIGSFLAPRLRERFAEGKLLLGGLGTTTVVSLLAMWVGGLSGAGVLAFVVGFSAASSKVAFDAIVQRDAVGATHGATFARFETRFQLAWVIGALIPVIFPIGIRVGALIMALAAGFAAASYYFGGRSASDGIVSPMSAAGLRGRLRRRTPAAESSDTAAAEVAEANSSAAESSTPGSSGETGPTAAPQAPSGRGRSRGGRRLRRAGLAEDVSHDALDVPEWIGSTPPELQSIRPTPKPNAGDGSKGSSGMWDDHR